MGPIVGTIDIDIPNLGNIVGNLFILATFVAALFFFIQVVMGGISWINAGGDPKALDSARGRITNAVIGIILVIAAFVITLILTTALGVNIF